MSQSITEFNLYKIKQELLNRFRYGFNDLDTLSRITETTTTFDGDGSNTTFTLSPSNLSYVKSVSVSGTPLTYGSEWSINWRDSNKGSVETVTPPASGTDNVSIVWGNTGSNTNFVWGDFPREDLGVHNYPRVGFKTTTSRTPGGLSGKEHIIRNSMMIQIKIVDTDIFNIDYIASEIDDWFLANAKGWYYFNFATAQDIGEFDNYQDNTEITNYKILTYIIPDKIQKVTYT